jgi:hypothetical protein
MPQGNMVPESGDEKTPDLRKAEKRDQMTNN